MNASDLAARMREVLFAGHNVAFTPMQAARHHFGIRLIRVLSSALRIAEASALHAMLLWTISVSLSARGGNLDMCVACLIVSVKMQAMVAIGMTRFATACSKIFQPREHVSQVLEWTLQHDPDPRELVADKVSHLTSVLKMLDSADLVSEVVQLSSLHLRYAEIFLLFTSLRGQWYRYLIEMFEYVRSKTQEMSSAARLALILEVCNAQDA